MAPRKRSTGRSKTKTDEVEIYCRGSISRDTIERFDALAKQEMRSRNAHFMWVIQDYINRNK